MLLPQSKQKGKILGATFVDSKLLVGIARGKITHIWKPTRYLSLLIVVCGRYMVF